MWKANKFVSILLWVLFSVSIILCGYVFLKAGGLNVKTQRAEILPIINPMFIWTYILVAIAAIVAVVLPVPQVIKNPASAVGLAVGVLSFVVVVGLAFLFSKGTPLPFNSGHPPVSEGTIKYTDVNLISVYIMLGASILATFGFGIVNIFKMR